MPMNTPTILFLIWTTPGAKIRRMPALRSRTALCPGSPRPAPGGAECRPGGLYDGTADDEMPDRQSRPGSLLDLFSRHSAARSRPVRLKAVSPPTEWGLRGLHASCAVSGAGRPRGGQAAHRKGPAGE